MNPDRVRPTTASLLSARAASSVESMSRKRTTMDHVTRMENHVVAGRSPAHERQALPVSLSYTEVLRQQALGCAEKALADIRELRRHLEPFNAAVMGAAVNAAEQEVQSIRHRLLEPIR